MLMTCVATGWTDRLLPPTELRERSPVAPTRRPPPAAAISHFARSIATSEHCIRTMALLYFFVACLMLIPLPESSLDTVDETYTFEQFTADFGKVYSDDEHAHRKNVFESNLRHILEHKAKDDKSYTLGINHFMDLESHEVPRGYDKSFHAAWKSGLSESDATLMTHQRELPFEIEDVSTLPESVDWRTRGVVTPVKFQGFCGSCWAFASTTVLESHIALQTNVLYTLSVQELVSCVDNPRSCGGGELLKCHCFRTSTSVDN